MRKLKFKNLFFCLMLSLAIADYVNSLKCYYCENCSGINLKNRNTHNKAIQRECAGNQKFCIRAEQKSTNSNGKEEMRIVALGCVSQCNQQNYLHTGLKASCCRKNLCNLPKRNNKKKGRKGKKGRKYGRSTEENLED